MHLVLGLGNPGHRYDRNRHNVGYLVLDELRRLGDLPDWRGKFSGSYTKGDAFGGEVVLLKPETFMNRSGECVRPALAFFKVEPAHLVVVHDELDMPYGDVRIKLGGGHAGHNGLRSVISLLGTADFVRLRIGIGRPPAGADGHVVSHVLGDFASTERSELPEILRRAAGAVERVLRDGVAAAMNAVNAL